MAESTTKTPKFNIGSLRKDLGSNSFADAKYKKPNYWLDTGCYAINRIMSGNTKNGIPGGRLTCIAGESQTCKSMIAARAIKSAQEQGIVFTFYLDTEGGALYEYMDQLGIDGDKVEQIVISSAEMAVSTMIKVFDAISTYQKQVPDAKFLIVLDSIGNLRCEKLYSDGLKGTSPIDMGGVARRIGDMVSFATPKALTTDTAVILLNHIYENPGEMMPQKIKANMVVIASFTCAVIFFNFPRFSGKRKNFLVILIPTLFSMVQKFLFFVPKMLLYVRSLKPRCLITFTILKQPNIMVCLKLLKVMV